MATSSGDPGEELDDEGYPLPLPGYCNARIDKNGQKSRCGLVQGWGTDYYIGCCRKHSGAHRNGRQHAAASEYEAVYAQQGIFGRTVDVDPMVGILDVVAEYAGFAAYVKAEIAATAGPDGRVQLLATVTGAGGTRDVVHPKVTLWLDVLDRYAKACKMAGDLGVEKTKIDLVSAYQDRVLDILENVLRAAGLDPDDPDIAALVSGQLALVAGPSPAIEPLLPPRKRRP